MRAFSPSATEDFLFCPMFRSLRRTGLQGSKLGKMGLAGIFGTAFAAGVGAYNLARKHGVTIGPSQVSTYVDIAIAVIRQHLADADAAGLVTTGFDVSTRGALESRMLKILPFYCANDPIPPQWTVDAVELTMEEGGDCRLDLGLISPMGPVVVDYKTKITYEDKYLVGDSRSWQDSEQRFHYSHFYGQRVGAPVWQFAICLVIVEPKARIHLLQWPNNDELIAKWYQSRVNHTWPRMEEARNRPVEQQEMAAVHGNKFGPCQFRGHCLDNHGNIDISTTSGDFVMVPRV